MRAEGELLCLPEKRSRIKNTVIVVVKVVTHNFPEIYIIYNLFIFIYTCNVL